MHVEWIVLPSGYRQRRLRTHHRANATADPGRHLPNVVGSSCWMLAQWKACAADAARTPTTAADADACVGALPPALPVYLVPPLQACYSTLPPSCTPITFTTAEPLSPPPLLLYWAMTVAPPHKANTLVQTKSCARQSLPWNGSVARRCRCRRCRCCHPAG